MTDSYIITHNTWDIIRHVQHAIILNVRVVADNNTIKISGQYRMIPDACTAPQGPSAQHNCARRNVHSRTKLWLGQQGSRQPFFEVDHPAFIEDSRFDVDKKNNPAE